MKKKLWKQKINLCQRPKNSEQNKILIDYMEY